MLMKKLAAGAATAAIALSIAAVAQAQSTAGQANEVIVTGARAVRSTAGLATQINDAKDEAIIGKAFIETQVPSQNVGQLINMLPGVSYSTEDPGGLNGGDLRIHGFDGAHVAFILDGAPLNDTGNYAIYPGEYIIGELIDHITVNIGSSDVDSPSAAALGATINVTTKNPSTTMGGQVKVTGGSYGFHREFGEFDTGAIGPWGTRAYIAAENVYEDNVENRPGYSQRQDISGKIYQPLSGTDFISLSGIYVQERQYAPFDVTPGAIAADGRFFFGDNYTWVKPTVTPGKPDGIPGGVGPAGADNQFYGLFPNPVNFSSIRGESKFSLGNGLTFTFDPSFFYTLANGGGGKTLAENSFLLIDGATPATVKNSRACISGGKVTGVDLNGDGDCLDTVTVYGPSNTETYRYGLTSSLLWDMNEHNRFQLSYTGDLGLHRQTGEYTTVDPNTGLPASVFGGHPGYGPQIATADGVTLQTRDRRSVAILNQVSLNYIGRFMDDKLHVNVGVRAPFFYRETNNNCDTYNGSSVTCGSAAATNNAALQTAYNADLAANRAAGAKATALSNAFGATVNTGPGGVPEFRFPFKGQENNYNKLLPNVGVSYRVAENNLFYISYARGFAAPKTDDLYTAPLNNVQPETSDNFTGGYRYQTRWLNASFNLYDTEYQNRIVQTQDPTDPTTSIDRNVGNARIYGLDFEVGATPIEHLHLYASMGLNHSELLSNYTSASSGAPFLVPTKGKSLVMTPNQTYATRISYDFGPVTLGGEAKYLGGRYITDTNDARIGGYAVFNVDARYNLPFFNGKSYIQANILNLFNRQYISRSTTVSFASYTPPEIGKNLTNTFYYYVGAPSTFTLTLNAAF